jgi:hypothetical protein
MIRLIRNNGLGDEIGSRLFPPFWIDSAGLRLQSMEFKLETFKI